MSFASYSPVEFINLKKNIIAGPGARDYFSHNPGFSKELIKEEGPFPVQGNIGALVADETNDFMKCISGPNIEGSPNCTGSFTPDIYTKVNTCGDECIVKYPESYGIKDFGFPDISWEKKITNSHNIHEYLNQRAAGPGQGSGNMLGPIEWIPRVSINKYDTGFLNPEPQYSQVGNFLNLEEYAYMTQTQWSKDDNLTNIQQSVSKR